MASVRGESGSAAQMTVAVVSTLVAVVSLFIAVLAVAFDFFLNGTSTGIEATALSQDVGQECLNFQDWAREKVDQGTPDAAIEAQVVVAVAASTVEPFQFDSDDEEGASPVPLDFEDLPATLPARPPTATDSSVTRYYPCSIETHEQFLQVMKIVRRR